MVTGMDYGCLIDFYAPPGLSIQNPDQFQIDTCNEDEIADLRSEYYSLLSFLFFNIHDFATCVYYTYTYNGTRNLYMYLLISKS